MKTVQKIAVFALVLASSNMRSQTAGQYMDKIGKEFNRIQEETWDYARAVAHGKKAKQVDGRRRDMLNANRSALSKIKNMQGFNGDASYRDSVVKYLEMSYLVLNNDYSKIVDLEEVAEQSYDAMEAYMTAQQLANDKLDAAFAVAYGAQLDFAKNNNIRLVNNESETEAKLEKAGEVFKYYNGIYLVFFKPYKQEFYLLDAQNKNDVNGMKQNQEALAKLSKESKEKLKGMKPYKNNNTLITTCGDVLDFYIYEAEKQGPALVDFYMKKEKFEKLKTVMDKKGKNPTQQEANEFNTAVNEYNKAVNDYNNINNDLNNRRTKNLENWNNAVSRFLDRNVSKKK